MKCIKCYQVAEAVSTTRHFVKYFFVPIHIIMS